MKISVIVPVYNVEEYIIECIDSLIKQTFKDFEIIVVNDGTKDSSIKLIQENFKDDRIKIFNKKNGGLASARNYGVKKATGDYLFFVDSDDFLDYNCLKEMYDKIKKSKCNLVVCDYYKYYTEGSKEHVAMIKHYDKDNSKTSVTAMPGAVGKLIKRDIYLKYKIQFLENHFFEDNAVMPFLCAVCGDYEYIQKPFYYYRQRMGSILNKPSYDKRWEDIYDSLDNLYNLFDEYKLIDEYKEELEYIYIEYLLHASNLRFIEYDEAKDNIIKSNKIMMDKFPSWRNNKYFKKESLKYKVMLYLFSKNKIDLIKLLRRI